MKTRIELINQAYETTKEEYQEIINKFDIATKEGKINIKISKPSPAVEYRLSEAGYWISLEDYTDRTVIINL